MALPVAVSAYIARRDQELVILENAPPPELRLAIDITRCVEELQGRAQALEAAMARATAISEHLQRGIERERQQLSEVNEEYLRTARLNDLTPEEAVAVAILLDHQQARSGRRAFWQNVAVALVFWALGIVTPLLINIDALGDQLREWLHLG
jgi:hypothetical protein